MGELVAPFPYFGGKSRAADRVWQAFGEVENYVEPFAGEPLTFRAAESKPS
jgi:site-specific DNA-adenine methylase